MPTSTRPSLSLSEHFGFHRPRQVARDALHLIGRRLKGEGFAVAPSSLKLVRPELSFPAYASRTPPKGVSPIYNFFDRVGGGLDYRNNVTNRRARDWRGGRLTYDEHDGTDFVVPPGTPLVAAAPGIVVSYRSSWLRGGRTLTIDHGAGVLTQYSHMSQNAVEIGQPLKRGDLLGWSGVSGAEMTSFCPWVPPHLHFTVFAQGLPVDPYGLSEAESGRPAWWSEGKPLVFSGPLEGDLYPSNIEDVEVDLEEFERVLALCKDYRIFQMLSGEGAPATRLALCEDSLHHERFAWPQWEEHPKLRRQVSSRVIWLTLPLDPNTYQSAEPADNWLTRPR